MIRRHARGRSKVASLVRSFCSEKGPSVRCTLLFCLFLFYERENKVMLLFGLFLIIQQTIPCIIGPTESYCQTSKWEELKLSAELNFWKMEKEKASH